ncbi:MAG: NTP transferase domain-containing protein [Deltaproteobacteria bacterium]|nr:NTP transferase domain-containing protein [Deltaproteobacteria bacterium]
MTRPEPIRTAFILGAGLGRRLRPLTEKCPKPLLPAGGRPMIHYVMEHLRKAGVERFIINTHHCPEAYEKAFPDGRWRGVPVTLRYEPVLLDTGGGLKNIEDLLTCDKRLFVYNGKILTDLPLKPLIEAHEEGGSEVTLGLRSDGPLCNVSLDEWGAVRDLRHVLGRTGGRLCQFAGIYIAEKSFFRRLQAGRAESVVEAWLRVIQEGKGGIRGVVIDEGRWHNLGTIEEYERIACSIQAPSEDLP